MKSSVCLHISLKSKENCLVTFKYLPESRSLFSDAMVPLKVLCHSTDYLECWFDESLLQNYNTDSEGVTESQNHLVFCYHTKEKDISSLTKQAYSKAYQCGAEHGFPYLIRTWNYLHDINGTDNGLERYQSFCVARHEVLEKFDQLKTPNPAATAIGSHNGESVFVFLFAKQAGLVIENKRQVSAWDYPKIYSPKQPRFSRAMKCDSTLMCSGTASVVGHETLHLNDVLAQFDECMKNISVLLSEAGNSHTIESGLYRFYLRDAEHALVVESKIKEFGIQNYIVLHGDVCRENLLIECEVVFQ